MLLTPGRRRQRSPASHPRLGQTGFRKWSRPDEELRGGLCTPQSAASQARVRNLHLLPEPGTPPPDSPPGGARPEGGVRVWHWALRSAAPRRGRNSLVAERVCLSGWPNPPGVAKGPTWRSGKLRGDPQATKTEWAPPGQANLNPFLVPPGLLPMLKTLPPPVSHPGAPRLATGQVAAPRKQATRSRRKRTCPARTETESTAWLEKASGTYPERRK